LLVSDNGTLYMGSARYYKPGGGSGCCGSVLKPDGSFNLSDNPKAAATTVEIQPQAWNGQTIDPRTGEPVAAWYDKARISKERIRAAGPQLAHTWFRLPNMVSSVNLSLYDASGRRVRTVYSGKGQQGLTRFDAGLNRLPKGYYVLRLRAGDQGVSRTLLAL
jgi:hypothetical protein